jgi:hypothetical protein
MQFPMTHEREQKTLMVPVRCIREEELRTFQESQLVTSFTPTIWKDAGVEKLGNGISKAINSIDLKTCTQNIYTCVQCSSALSQTEKIRLGLFYGRKRILVCGLMPQSRLDQTLKPFWTWIFPSLPISSESALHAPVTCFYGPFCRDCEEKLFSFMLGKIDVHKELVFNSQKDKKRCTTT